MMQIVLLGYMGSGKSTIGAHLSEELGVRFLDLDNQIEAREGCSIPEIFERRGALYFRKQEDFHLREILSSESDFVLATGGGTPCYGNNMETLLASKAEVIYLKVPIAELVRRLSKQKEHRPLIRHVPDAELPEFIGKHLFERNNFYTQADLILDCGDKTPESIAEELAILLREIVQKEEKNNR